MLFWNKSGCFYLFSLLTISIQVNGSQVGLDRLKNWDLGIKTRKADRLFDEGLYHDAIPVYEQIIHFYPLLENQSINHLATCYLEIDSFQAALSLLTAYSPLPIKDSTHLFLKCISYRRLNRYQAALKVLKLLQQTTGLNNRVIFEKGLNLYYLEEFESALNSFQSIKWDFQAPSLYFLAQLYRARLYILQNHPSLAAQVLENLMLPEPALEINKNCFDFMDSKSLLFKLNLERNYLLGVCSYSLQDYRLAAAYFHQVLQTCSSNKSAWFIPTLRQLTACYLCQVNEMSLNSKKRNKLFNKFRASLKQLLAISREEKDYFLLGDFYLSQAYFLQNKRAYQKAEQLFNRKELFLSHEGSSLAALKLAASLTSYSERSKQFKTLTGSNQENTLHKQCLLHRASDEFKEGILLLHEKSLSAASDCFKDAFHSFYQAFILTMEFRPHEACPILKQMILASILHPSPHQAKFIQNLIDEHAPVLSNHSNWPETLYLSGVLWKEVVPEDESYLAFAKKNLEQAAGYSANKKLFIASLLELGSLYFHQENWDQAESTFRQISYHYPDCSRALFWQALCAEKKLLPNRKVEILNALYMNDPHGLMSPLAYFYTYTYREYLQGDRKIIKHLKAMPALFPDHPLTMNACYLMGLDHKKDHLSDEGKIIKGANLMGAIDAFQQAESLFDHLSQKFAFPEQTLFYYLIMRYKCMLERALANFALAKESHGTKQQIYFEYAGQVFKNLIEELKNCSFENVPLEQIRDEAVYKLAQTYLKIEKEEEAEKVLDSLITRYQKKSLSQGYLLTKAWYQKGKIASNRQDFSLALSFFQKAEQTSQEHSLLSPDQKINLWIQQSNCCKKMGQSDLAMLLLSKAVNHDVISALRIKAMYLRADLYELQNRPELAHKQLKAIARKGGIWGNKAKEKLKDEYED